MEHSRTQKNTNKDLKSKNSFASKNKFVKKAKKQEKSRIIFLLFTVVIFIVILISTVFNDVMQIMRNKKEIQELSEKYVELLDEEASLNSEVIKLQDRNYVERYAREKYLYTKEGEKILTIIENPSQKKAISEDSTG